MVSNFSAAGLYFMPGTGNAQNPATFHRNGKERS